MKVVNMIGWKEGLEKITLTKLQMESLNLSLKEAKSNVDNLLDDKQIILKINDNDLAIRFYNSIVAIGVIAELKELEI